MLYVQPAAATATTVECPTWDDAVAALDVYASEADLAQAKAMLAAGARQWNFVYGFTHATVSTFDPRVEDVLGQPALKTV